VSISNKSSEGVAELRRVLAEQAASLPQMGQPWPQSWLAAEQTLEARPDHHITVDAYIACCAEHGVDSDVAQGTLGNYLHDLGKILYFRDDYMLRNLVVLKPNWVTKAISRVVTDEPTRAAGGILRHADLPRIWAADAEGDRYAAHLYPMFLRLMERFDLSYQIEAAMPNTPALYSLVPQLLPHEPPANLPAWPTAPPAGQAAVEMVYRLDIVPAGIMSWFIVRTHRFTRNLHWREGVLLMYEGHEARVELNPMLRAIRMVVYGPSPYNFFSILKDTLDLILQRFPGLAIVREVPCICQREHPHQPPCGRFYRYEDLVRRYEAGRRTVECPETLAEVPLLDLLYGIHASTNEQVMQEIQQGQKQLQSGLESLHQGQQGIQETLTQLNQQSQLIGRLFLRQWNLELHKLEAECPSTFLLMQHEGSRFNPKNWASQEYELWLTCQYPAAPHPVGDPYVVRQAADWWVAISPWLQQLVTLLKFGVPMGQAVAGVVVDEDSFKQMKANIELLDQITKSVPELSGKRPFRPITSELTPDEGQAATGAALRALYKFLTDVDPNRIWGGLTRTVTPDGTILWLCGRHRRLYEAQELSPAALMSPNH
jgi:hypothetical protein